MSALSERAIDSISQSSDDHWFQIAPYPYRVQASRHGQLIVDSRSARVMHETRLADVLYFPRSDVRMEMLEPSPHRTHCPFKGNASYFSLVLDGERIDNAAWSYEQPLDGAQEITDYIAFYPDVLDRWLRDGKLQRPETNIKSESAANPLLPWLMTEAPDCINAYTLTRSLIDALLSTSVPVWRINVIIRTLHPQLSALSYRWWLKSDQLEELRVPYTLVQEPEFLNSPLIPIFDGAGGIRRRLDIDDPLLDFPILRQLHSEGATDYVAMPMVFSDGQINVISVTSAERGGFATRDLGHLYEILPLLGRLYEVHAMRERANTLLDTYLGHHAGTRVLNGHIKRGDGENIDAVIWFCDLRDSTPLAQSMPRKSFLGLLNKFFDCMAGAVLDNGGHVLRFIGDAALAIFPISMGDHGESISPAQARDNALSAARAACERMAAINRRRHERGRTELNFGIGLHQGEVTYGNIGTENRLEFTVIGDAANCAARIESMCKTLNCHVVVSDTIANHNPSLFRPLGQHGLRGITTPIELYCLHDVE